MNKSDLIHNRPTVSPACDIFENKDGVLLVMDLPGVMKDRLSINIEKDTLTVYGERDPHLPEGMELIAGQSHGWDFKRQFTVGTQIDQGAIKAELKNGVLEILLPRSEHTKPRRIEIA